MQLDIESNCDVVAHPGLEPGTPCNRAKWATEFIHDCTRSEDSSY